MENLKDFWEIDGNYWSRDKYSYNEALEASKTLYECKNCVDCKYCDMCNSCEYCFGCNDCNECESCITCTLCEK